jgi:hypothetical protein
LASGRCKKEKVQHPEELQRKERLGMIWVIISVVVVGWVIAYALARAAKDGDKGLESARGRGDE